HLAATWRYFWSIGFPPPRIEGSGQQVISAAADIDVVWQMQQSSERGAAVQVGGQQTKTPEDDRYRYRSRY
ncbi:MAG: hypothetical protein AAFN74_15110, partial [Myxococcota bacterium]